jgi:hypothetical protein
MTCLAETLGRYDPARRRKEITMPTFVIKPKRDEDFYVYWSTVVDCPVACGTRAEMLTQEDVTEERMQRADANGSSDRMGWFWWENDLFLCREVKGCNPDAANFVRRERLRELCERMQQNADASDLLEVELDD